MVDIPATVWRDGTPQKLTEEQEKLKRDLYDRMKPIRRKFIDRIGYDNWDPFPKPNDPIEMRQDLTGRTTQQLVREFMHSLQGAPVSNEYSQGVLDAALGIVNKDEKTLGRYAFCAWYDDLLRREGHLLAKKEEAPKPSVSVPTASLSDLKKGQR